jgi:hypothetical protein
MVDPNATPTQVIVQPASALPPTRHTSASTSHDSGSGNKSELYLAWDDWDFDFDGAIWPKSNEPVDPNLSLGVIIWHPAKQMTRALPATFEEAEEQSLKPTPEELGNGESVSIYFTAENSHEAFLDVRQTDEWDYIKDDPVFVIFTDEETRSATDQTILPTIRPRTRMLRCVKLTGVLWTISNRRCQVGPRFLSLQAMLAERRRPSRRRKRIYSPRLELLVSLSLCPESRCHFPCPHMRSKWTFRCLTSQKYLHRLRMSGLPFRALLC